MSHETSKHCKAFGKLILRTLYMISHLVLDIWWTVSNQIRDNNRPAYLLFYPQVHNIYKIETYRK